jgi:hypothetical protein
MKNLLPFLLVQPGDSTKHVEAPVSTTLIWILIIIAAAIVGYFIYKYQTIKKDDPTPPTEPAFKPKDPTPKL